MKIEAVPAYELVMCQDISDIHSTGYLLKHKKSGAKVMVIENEDVRSLLLHHSSSFSFLFHKIIKDRKSVV